MMEIGAISLTHQKSSAIIRQRVTVPKDLHAKFIREFQHQFSLKGMLILSTCNRFEIYYEGKACNPLEMIMALFEFQGLLVDPEIFSRFELLLGIKQVTRHMSRVGLGLESAVWGDDQAIGQLKKAYQFSLQNKSQGTVLERICQAAFRIHKRVVKETNFKSGSESWSYLSLKTLAAKIRKPEKSSLLIVGAGSLARDVLKYVPKFSFGQVGIINRTNHKSQAMADEFKVQFEEWKDLPAVISKYQAVIFTAGVKEPLVSSKAQLETPSKHRVWIDLGLPANVDPLFKEKAQHKIYNLDYFTTRIEENQQQKKDLGPVISLIRDEIQKMDHWYQQFKLRKKEKINV